MDEQQNGAEQPYAGYEQDLAARRARSEGIDKARATVLPGALKAAFASWPVVVKVRGTGSEPVEYTLQPVTCGLLTLLVKIKSPLLDVIKAYRTGRSMEEVKKEVEAMDPRPEALIETVFCFVTPAPALRGLMARGPQAFGEAAMREVGDKVHPAELSLLHEAVAMHYANSFRTAIEYEPTADPGGTGTVFSEPPAKMTTDLAGG